MENKGSLNWVRFGEHACVWARPHTSTYQLARAETFERNTIYAARPIRSQPQKIAIVFSPGSQQLCVPLAVPHEQYRIRFVVTETYMLGEPARFANVYCEHIRIATVRTTCRDINRIRSFKRHPAPYWSFPIASWYVVGRGPLRLPDPNTAPLGAAR